ncbi:arylesterase [Paracoccus denitrificans]|jgi:acyl-CoA thioesterase-1|uniref:Lipolytic enzyme, G-D-S-L family n=1 Tax=Paracoccus denitrificans (strain Pd 1222) TaxID=318586 RepID=A1AZD8_PARDP|nr:arylesterase [Paracoccus denitrificans]ABL68632.1 lipolytic enzyme, G-D-S-L family [Paracoccus denitrificans PD1222]MBB4625643.1 acyl-CoA thioesterase-1 [Paracoccus denitrificans]MCU7427188.1 arylesterase [Paracoccus denitrificans]UFS64024.1 arylesterase [Paracoccus denitrificans]UPV95640.1 arylesterase [Paracoccus denitrificans]
MMLRTLVLILALAAVPAAATPLRILAFGDSLTEGYGLPRKDGLVPQLQDWLRARGHDVLVLNGGLSGDTTAGGRVRIGYSLARHKPDAVIVELGGNDLLMGFAPQMVEGNLDSILGQAGRGGRPLLLVGIASPDHDDPLRRDWAGIWPRMATQHDALLMENLYQPLFDLPGDGYKAMLQPDGLHASAKGVGLIVQSLGPKVEALIEKAEARR